MKAIFIILGAMTTSAFLAGATTGTAAEIFASSTVLCLLILIIAIYEELKELREKRRISHELNKPRRNQK